MLDSSFLISLLEGESAAQKYAPILVRGYVPSVTAGETFYKLHASAGVDPDEIEAGLLALGVTFVDISLAAARTFPMLRSIDAVRRREQKQNGERPVQTLSLGDLCVLGCAITHNMSILTGDRHWETLRPHGLAVEVVNFRTG